MSSACEDLCRNRPTFDFYKNFKFTDCFNLGSDRSLDNVLYDKYKAVIEYSNIDRQAVNRHPAKIVLKSRNKYFLDFDPYLDFDFNQKPISEQLKLLIAYMKSTLKTKYDIDIDPDVQKWYDIYLKNETEALRLLKNDFRKQDLKYYLRLLSLNYADFERAIETKDKHLLATYITNLVILMSQDEYLFLRYFQNKPGTLKVYGTCGHFYFVEYAQSLQYQVRNMALNERKELTLKFLELVHNLDTVYLLNHVEKKDKLANGLVSAPMQMCDVKLDNFGLNERRELKIIDTDMVFPDKYIYNERVCSSHDECHFFDCKSFCDLKQNKCVQKRVNNNLQAFCAKLFYNEFNKHDGTLSGALSSFDSNVQAEIERRLNTCKLPGFYSSDSQVPVAAKMSLIRAFEILLNDKGVKQPSQDDQIAN